MAQLNLFDLPDIVEPEPAPTLRYVIYAEEGDANREYYHRVTRHSNYDPYEEWITLALPIPARAHKLPRLYKTLLSAQQRVSDLYTRWQGAGNLSIRVEAWQLRNGRWELYHA